MAGFLGTRCVVCNEKFNKSDAIVVCPECGTPYHKDCYLKSGSCVNTALHLSGREWQPSYDVGDDESVYKDEVICEKCGLKNPPLSLFCGRCGYPLSTFEIHNENIRKMEQASAYQNTSSDPKVFNRNEYGRININPYLINFSDKLCGYSPDEEFEGVKLSELADYVDTNTHYYLPLFKRIKDTGKSISWNFIAMLFPELYFANRKMPLLALIAVVFRGITIIPSFIEMFSSVNIGLLTEFALKFDVKSSAFQMFQTLVFVITYSLMFVGGGFANLIYYKHAVKKISHIKERIAKPKESTDIPSKLQKKGGTSGLLLSIFICIDALPYILLYMYGILNK